MPPRKSLPARSPVTTPRAGPLQSSRSQSTLKRPRSRIQPDPPLSLEPDLSSSPAKRKSTRTRQATTPAAQTDIKPNGEGADGENGIAEENVDPEAELEAWQDFAADHYEMVEQLPLELHRNFRLLRELDDGCLIQMDKLHGLVRTYAVQRLEMVKPKTPLERLEPEASKDAEAEPQEAEQILPPEVKAVSMEETQQTPGVPMPDGAGGLLVSATLVDDAEAAEHTARLEFPTMIAAVQRLDGSPDDTPNGQPTVIHPASQPTTSSVPALAKSSSAPSPPSDTRNSRRPEGPHMQLPEIARLAREIVRTGEEKVAVAVGAYNAIDRHIRALDSALTAQEASILLGLRPSTLPSSNVNSSLNLVGDTGGLPDAAPQPEGDEAEVTIGVGGGGGSRRGKHKKGKKGQLIEVPQASVEDVEKPAGTEAWNIPADPNEPRYCYCHQVSYGEMIGCENEECPYEWFHLSCVGLQASPTGKWWCEVCRPRIGLAKGGAGTIVPKNVGVGAGGSGRKKR
ncbi:hypothetical protein IAR55_003463 [Kwoniella newhampshirensis]|uniref:Chromatin modification-related protein n=1 Tax=Kwoniella newhampshirensis TaxID=1651941 RepID=A0AAW0YRQ6_9TREE